MKFLSYLTAVVFVIIVLGACKKENTPTIALNEKVDLAVAKPVSNSGSFNNGPYGTVNGSARIYQTDNRYQLALENFMASNGPDLKVYISKEIQPVNFINLSPLKSTTGNQLYDIPANINVKDYAYVLIYCERYSHLFGYAQFIY